MTSKDFRRRAVRSVREYLTMERELVRSDSQGPGWPAAREAVRRAAQLRDSAELLLARGSNAEGIHLVLAGLARLREAAAALADGDAAARPRVQELLRDADPHAARLDPAPSLDDHVTPDQAAAAQELVALELGLERALREAFLDRPGLLRMRRQRWVLAALVLAAPAAIVAVLHAVLYGVSARSSSDLSEQFTADRAVDGDPATYWAPGGSDEQWLELRFRPRHLHQVRVLNGDTRAARGLRMELYAGLTRLASESKDFAAEYPPGTLVFDVPNLRADRVRLVVTSHFGAGGGIAEVTLK